MIKIDTNNLRRFARNLHDDVNYDAVLNRWIGDVTHSITRSHGRAYSYVTPPASNRNKLRRREGKLIKAITESKFVDKLDKNNFIAGYDMGLILNRAPYAEYHINEHIGGNKDYTTLKPTSGPYIFIPLRAALSSNGTKLIEPPSSSGYTKRRAVNRTRKASATKEWVKKESGFLWTNVHTAQAKGLCSFAGENVNKFHDNTVILIKNGVPCFIAAKKITIPKRLTINKELVYFYNKPSGHGSLIGSIDKEIDKMLSRVVR